jgi:choline dehydrogenase
LHEDRYADYIVVGAGSAGAVVARRMVDAGASVLLLEAGGPDTSEAIHDPARALDLEGAPEDWAYETVPQPGAAGRRIPWPRGRVLGGSSATNGMVWIRGAPADYDNWAYAGNAGWSYAELLPLFRRMEDFDRGASELHGSGGPIRVIADWERGEIHRSFVSAAAELAIPFNDDPNGSELLGASFVQFNIRDGRRETAAVAYLAQVASAPGLEVLTGAHVRRLRFDGSRVTGVEYAREGALERARAAREVVLCSGVVGSAQLLLLSGIGPAAHLAAVGIAPLVDLPGVGANLHDHVHVPVVFATDRAPDDEAPGLSPVQAQIFWRTDPRLPVPDLQPVYFNRPMYEAGMSGTEHGFTIGVLIVRPASRGMLRLASADPEDPPLLDPQTYACAADMTAMLSGVALVRALGATGALARWGARELAPGAGVEGAALERWVRRRTLSSHHQVGTARMGTDALAVVDPQLRVYGVSGLRVADASIMPAVTSGNTHAPATMIGERASDLLLDRGAATDVAPAARARPGGAQAAV